MKLYVGQNGALDRVKPRRRTSAFRHAGRTRSARVQRQLRESDDQWSSSRPAAARSAVSVGSFQVRGPFNPKGLSDTPSRTRIFVCKPPDKATNAAEAACARQIISSLAARAYRRPVTAEDVKELFAYYEDGIKEGGFEGGVRSAVWCCTTA